MKHFEIFNPASGHSFGIYEAQTEEDAIAACVKEAGYLSVAEMLRSVGQLTCELQATAA